MKAKRLRAARTELDHFREGIAKIDRTPHAQRETAQREFGKWFHAFAGGLPPPRGRPRRDDRVRRVMVLFAQAVQGGCSKSIRTRHGAYHVVAAQVHLTAEGVRKLVQREARRERRRDMLRQSVRTW